MLITVAIIILVGVFALFLFCPFILSSKISREEERDGKK